MNIMKNYLKEKCNLSNYQIAQLEFLGKTFISEISKILIMGILFYKYLPFYFFALLIMLILRCSTGGIHCSTYLGCLITSIIYIAIPIILLPNIEMFIYIKIFLMGACGLVCYYIGPVPSKYRPPFSNDFVQKCKLRIICFIFLYAIISYIIPDSKYINVGFWVIILHSLQLIVAKIIKRKEIS